MRVLAISSYGVLGGAELSLSAFVEHRPPGFEVSGLLLDDGPLRERLADLGVPSTVWSEFNRRPDLWAVVSFTRAVLPKLRRDPPDVVWATGQKAALLAAPACRAAGAPLVWHKVDLAYDRWLAPPLALSVDGVIGVCDAAVTALGPLGRRRVLGTVGPPVRLSPSLISAPDPARPAIGTLARLVPFKGHHHIIRAAALLMDEFPGLRIVLAGAPVREYPDYPAQLRALARELGLDGRVELPGFVEPGELLGELSVFVNATYRDSSGFGLEGLSGAILEASWAAVPVVATATGGTPEAVRDGETGTLVVDPAPVKLAAAIAPYLRDPVLARRTGAAGRLFARRFSPDACARRVFEMLAGAARRSASAR